MTLILLKRSNYLLSLDASPSPAITINVLMTCTQICIVEYHYETNPTAK